MKNLSIKLKQKLNSVCINFVGYLVISEMTMDFAMCCLLTQFKSPFKFPILFLSQLCLILNLVQFMSHEVTYLSYFPCCIEKAIFIFL
jgi:hypothetical protein